MTHYRAKAIETKILVLESKLDQMKLDAKNHKDSVEATLETINLELKRSKEDFNKALSGIRKTNIEDVDDRDSLRELVQKQQDTLSRVQFELDHLKKVKEQETQKQTFPEDKEQLYQRADQLIIEKNYGEAIRFYSEFVKRYPSDVRADDSLYHIAEAYYQQRKYDDAVSAIQQIIDEYPNENQADKSLILLHDTYIAMNKCSKAKKALIFLQNTYPRSNQLRNAQGKLSRLKCS